MIPGYPSTNVTEGGVWLLTSQKPVGMVGGKESVLYFRGWAARGEGRLLPEGWFPATKPEDNSIYRWRELHVERRPSALTVNFRLVIGRLTSVILIVLGTVNLQFQGRFASISLRPFLGTVAAYVTATVWLSCS